LNRETIYAALFAKVSGIAGVKSSSRRLKHYQDVSPADQPALFQRQVNEDFIRARGLPIKLNMKAELYLYVNTAGDSAVAPSTILNPLVDAIDAALAPSPGPENTQTLGGLVSHCWIGGAIEIFEGVLGDQAVVIIPIEMLATE